jgi:hypothetical protein
MDPDDYPEAWTPPHIRQQREAEMALALSVDTYVAALTSEEFDQMVARTRPAGDR